MFKSIAPAVLLLASFVAPTLASAQDLTRAQVRADLARVERAGYTPTASEYNYPANIQAAEARAHVAKPVLASR